MAIPTRLMGYGASAGLAASLCGGSSPALVAAGNSNANALGLSTEINVVTTTAAGTGVRLMPVEVGSSIVVSNLGANPLLVYPGAGAQINLLTVTTGGLSVPAGATAMFFGASGTRWAAMLGATPA